MSMTAAAPERLPRKRMLVVDDEPAMHDSYVRSFARRRGADEDALGVMAADLFGADAALDGVAVDGAQGLERRAGALVELPLVVRLHEGLEPEISRAVDQPRKHLPAMQDGEQQDRVCAGAAELVELARIDHELLREHRDRDVGAHGGEILDRSAEPVRLAEHRDRRCSARRVRASPGEDVVCVGGDPASRG